MPPPVQCRPEGSSKSGVFVENGDQAPHDGLNERHSTEGDFSPSFSIARGPFGSRFFERFAFLADRVSKRFTKNDSHASPKKHLFSRQFCFPAENVFHAM
jgi:hypothetical protein